MTTHTWRRADKEESERHIVAIYIAYHSMVDNKGRKREYQQMCPYTLKMIERRWARGGDLPYFITKV